MGQQPWRYILHADLDAFFASVEQRDDPSLRGRPVVVGGAPEARGVVAAASYEARRFGVRSAMPMRTALRLCPQAVRVPPRFSRYREVSEQVMAIFRALTPLVEPLSVDEAYLDVSQEVPPGGLEKAARALKGRVREEVGLAVTVGGGTTKSVAKIASEMAKPDGLLLVRPGEEREFLAPLGVERLWGVGPRTAELLRQRGVETIGDLAARDEGWLVGILGKRGRELRARAQGVDDDPVTVEREAKEVSAETTLSHDEDDEALLKEVLERLAATVARRLQQAGLRAGTVGIKLRLADFTTFSRQTSLKPATDDAEVLTREAHHLLQAQLLPGRRFRLLGVAAMNLRAEFQLPLPLDDAWPPPQPADTHAPSQ